MRRAWWLELSSVGEVRDDGWGPRICEWRERQNVIRNTIGYRCLQVAHEHTKWHILGFKRIIMVPTKWHILGFKRIIMVTTLLDEKQSLNFILFFRKSVVEFIKALF
jgi:hypothetical protein